MRLSLSIRQTCHCTLLGLYRFAKVVQFHNVYHGKNHQNSGINYREPSVMMKVAHCGTSFSGFSKRNSQVSHYCELEQDNISIYHLLPPAVTTEPAVRMTFRWPDQRKAKAIASILFPAFMAFLFFHSSYMDLQEGSRNM